MVAKGEVSHVRIETAQGSTIYGQQGGLKKSIENIKYNIQVYGSTFNNTVSSYDKI